MGRRSDDLYRATRETLDVTEDDQFRTITEHDAANFRYDAAPAIVRSDDLVFIQLTVFNTRDRKTQFDKSSSCQARTVASA
jgi:hypothetical protein